jgi:hypothetical protein
MSRPKRVIIDVDGCKANFIAGALPIIREITGRDHDHDDVDQFMIEKALGLTDAERDLLYARVSEEGWCYGLPMYEGAREGVTRIRAVADQVWAVTQRFKSRTWVYERDLWLMEKLAFAYDDILHVPSVAKHAIDADVMVEDKTSTLVQWQAAHPDGHGILVRRRYNENDGWTGIVVDTWHECADRVEELMSRR